MPELMTPDEIHALGVDVVVNQLEKDGHEIIEINNILDMGPQVVTKKGDWLRFFTVRTSMYPHKGSVEDHEHFTPWSTRTSITHFRTSSACASSMRMP